MSYLCERCGHQSRRKGDFKLHCFRKNTCSPSISNKSIEDIIAQHWSPPKEKTVCCSSCKGRFTSMRGLYNHRHRCRHTIALIDAEPTATTASTTASTTATATTADATMPTTAMPTTAINGEQNIGIAGNQNTVNSHNTTNIQIVAFDKSDLQYIIDNHDFILKCLKNKTVGMCELLERMHFDPEHPENHNIRKLAKKDNGIDLHNGGRWTTGLHKAALLALVNKMEHVIMQFYENCFENEVHVSDKTTRRFMEEVGVPLQWDIGDATEYGCNETFGSGRTEKDLAETNAELMALFKKCLYEYTANLTAEQKKKREEEKADMTV